MNSIGSQDEKSQRETNELKGTAVEQYLDYAKKAREQGYEYIAQLFEEAYSFYSKEF